MTSYYDDFTYIWVNDDIICLFIGGDGFLRQLKHNFFKTAILFMVIITGFFIVSQIWFYDLFMSNLIEHEIQSARNDVTYYLNLLDLMEYGA